MKRFVEGEDRRQGVLLPELLDDYVSEENPVRVIDVFVEELDLRALGFEGVVPEATGRPAIIRACRCTSGKERRIKRWEHEAVIDAMQERLDRRPDAMRIRRATVEHPFGTLKAWMGATHFKTRTLDKVRTEMSLHVLAYNLKRVVAMLGPQSLIEAIRA